MKDIAVEAGSLLPASMLAGGVADYGDGTLPLLLPAQIHQHEQALGVVIRGRSER